MNYGDGSVSEFAPSAVKPSKRKISRDLYIPEGIGYFPPLFRSDLAVSELVKAGLQSSYASAHGDRLQDTRLPSRK